jgi:predicted GH43/DUF377 family glycosyl hydrolase
MQRQRSLIDRDLTNSLNKGLSDLANNLNKKRKINGHDIELSTIGIAESDDRVSLTNRRQWLAPNKPWNTWGLEDPRVTYFEGKYYVFYTAISSPRPDADSIKVAVAVTSDFERIDEEYLVTPFNAKAFALFPNRVNGRVTAILSVNTDRPPSQIAIVQADNIEDFWKPEFWNAWYEKRHNSILPLMRSLEDHVEVGAVPLHTKHGFLLIYCYIRYYFTHHKIELLY